MFDPNYSRFLYVFLLMVGGWWVVAHKRLLYFGTKWELSGTNCVKIFEHEDTKVSKANERLYFRTHVYTL